MLTTIIKNEANLQNKVVNEIVKNFISLFMVKTTKHYNTYYSLFILTK